MSKQKKFRVQKKKGRKGEGDTIEVTLSKDMISIPKRIETDPDGALEDLLFMVINILERIPEDPEEPFMLKFK